MFTSRFFNFHRRPPVKTAFLLCAALLHSQMAALADSATVAANANTLITVATAQTSPYSLASGFNPSLALSLSNAEKWTNLPGTPPNDTARVGPVIGGGSVSYTTYELSSTVSSGQSVSPRQAAVNLFTSTTSTAGFNEMYEIRNADNVLSASGGGSAYNYSDYRADVLNNTTPSSTSDFMIKTAGHHLAYAFTYNFPAFNGGKAYTSASPMFLGLEPPDYQSTGTDLTTSSTSTAENAFIVGTNSSTAGSILAMYPQNSGTTLTTITAAAAATSLPARVNVTATAISGATSASYTISSTTASDNGFYYCAAINSSGTTYSNTVPLTIAQNTNSNLYQNTASTGTSPSPIITTQPQAATVTTGSSVTFSVVASGATSYQWYKIAATHRAAMETQRAAVSNLATAIQADSTLKSSALLSGTFSDVVEGSANANPNTGDSAFPQTYPAGTTGRGVLFSSMTTAEQTTLKPLIKATIEAWVNNAPSDAAAVLLADYESDAAINATYIGYANGSGAADSTGVTRCNFDATVNQEKTPQNSQHSYLRIDGPRVWIEMVVQNAVLYQSNGFVHYHSIYRDKLSDYGGEYGSSLNGASTASGYTGTTYTRPSFTTQPTSVTGSSATFTAVATANSGSGAVTPAYQWYSGTVGSGTAISGATSASYMTSTAGSYYVTATTAYGSTASNQVTLTAASATAPTITTQPATQTVVSGSTATFTVAATGNGTLSYQWYNASGAISGATAASYTTGTAGSYYVVVTNTVGTSSASTTSSTATLYVNVPPTITTQPVSQSINSGGTATFTVAATGNGTLSYQWYSGAVGSGTAISGATTASYTTGTAGTYYAVVTNTLNGTTTSTTSSAATLTVNSAPTITTQPASQTVVLGKSATFSVVATGTGTLSYQWYKGSVGSGTAISGATSSSYTIAQTTASSAGSYYVAVTNSIGTTNSTAATLTLQEPFAAYLATYGLSGVDPSVDSDGDGMSNLVEFVLGGNPTASDTAILPTSAYTTAGDTSYLVFTFYTVTNLGSATFSVESSPDLSTWTTVVSGTNGAVVTTTTYNANYNLTTAWIPITTGGRGFARLRATLPSTYTGTISGSTSASRKTTSATARTSSNKRR